MIWKIGNDRSIMDEAAAAMRLQVNDMAAGARYSSRTRDAVGDIEGMRSK